MSGLLLPCPFCGQKAYIRKRHHSMPRDPTYQAYCDDCGCGTSDLYRQPALAIQAWNQRAVAEKRITEIEGEIFPHHQELLQRARLLEAHIKKTEAERDTATRALRELFAFVWDHVRTGSEIDSFDAQPKLAELGLIRLEPVRTADEEIEWGETELWYPTALVENQESVT